MVKRKKRIIMYVTLIVMVTIGMLGIGGIALAENQEIAEIRDNGISEMSDETFAPESDFEIEKNEVTHEATITEYKGSGATTVRIPSTIQGYTVTSIKGPISGWYSLGSVKMVIPNTVTSIGNRAFEYTSLKEVEIPSSVTTIGIDAFSGVNFTSVEIPDSVTSIGRGAFGESWLKEIKIPNGVTSVEDSTFRNCSKLERIEIPNSVESIGWAAFQNCGALESITIPDSVTSIENDTFWGCSALKSITIPNKVTRIGSETFRDCISLETVVFPSTLTSLASNAFKDSAVSKLIFICQDKDDMRILDAVKINIPGNIKVYRMATDDIKNNYEKIESYEFVGQAISLDDMMKSGVIYEGVEGETEYTVTILN